MTTEAGSRVAFFGGSFDPPHNGHLAVARAARTGLALDRVLFAPVGAQPLKIQGGGQGARASFEDRVAMTRLAIAGEAGFEVSLADAPRTAGTANFSPNYSLETLERLRAELGWDRGAGSRLFFLVGADSFFTLRQWHRAAEIPFAASMVVASRPGQRPDELGTALPEGLTLERWAAGDAERGGVRVRAFHVGKESGEAAELYLLPGLNEPASASGLREKLRTMGNEATGEGWLPDAVANYVRARGLYR
jgi:nicotinate-nucleotide adenylyltransferase